MALALAARQFLFWRDEIDRLILAAEKAPANTENAGQIGPGKSRALAVGRDGAGTEVPVGD